MSARPFPRRGGRIAAITAAIFAIATTTIALASPASATTQHVSVVTSVNSVVNGPAYTNSQTTVSFAITNQSTTGAKLGIFSIVVPAGVTNITKAGVFAPGTWNETIVKCGKTPRCSAIVIVSAGLPLSQSLVGPGKTVTASITFKAPPTAGSLCFAMLGIGNGIFTVSGATPTVNVLDSTVAKFSLSVPSPITAGTATTVSVQTLNAANQIIPFAGGSVTFTITGDDSPAVLQGSAFGSGKSVTLSSLPAAPTGSFTLPATFFKAQVQTIMAAQNLVTGTSNPFTVVNSNADHLILTSIKDTSSDPALPSPVVNGTFAVAFNAVDIYGNPVAGVNVTLTALAPTLGTLTPTGFAITAADGTASITATYDTAQNNLELQVAAPSVTPATGFTDVVATAAVVTAQPNVPTSLDSGPASADLPQGGYGPVFLTTAPCTADGCPAGGTEITLAGTFTNPDNPSSELYSFAQPASVSWTCDDSACPHNDANAEPGDSDYNYNHNDSGDPEQEQIEDFNDYPIQVSLKVNGVYQPFAVAPSCQDLSTEFDGPPPTGVIATSQAQSAGFCVDVYAITRAGASFTGALTIPVLFVEDPKLRPSA
jgi:hypothetical protein